MNPAENRRRQEIERHLAAIGPVNQAKARSNPLGRDHHETTWRLATWALAPKSNRIKAAWPARRGRQYGAGKGRVNCFRGIG